MLFCQDIHYILMKNALLLNNLVIEIYALFFHQFFWAENSLCHFFSLAIWMYGFDSVTDISWFDIMAQMYWMFPFLEPNQARCHNLAFAWLPRCNDHPTILHPPRFN